jgi:hypothetical protein
MSSHVHSDLMNFMGKGTKVTHPQSSHEGSTKHFHQPVNMWQCPDNCSNQQSFRELYLSTDVCNEQLILRKTTTVGNEGIHHAERRLESCVTLLENGWRYKGKNYSSLSDVDYTGGELWLYNQRIEPFNPTSLSKDAKFVIKIDQESREFGTDAYNICEHYHLEQFINNKSLTLVIGEKNVIIFEDNDDVWYLHKTVETDGQLLYDSLYIDRGTPEKVISIIEESSNNQVMVLKRGGDFYHYPVKVDLDKKIKFYDTYSNKTVGSLRYLPEAISKVISTQRRKIYKDKIDKEPSQIDGILPYIDQSFEEDEEETVGAMYDVCDHLQDLVLLEPRMLSRHLSTIGIRLTQRESTRDNHGSLLRKLFILCGDKTKEFAVNNGIKVEGLSLDVIYDELVEFFSQIVDDGMNIDLVNFFRELDKTIIPFLKLGITKIPEEEYTKFKITFDSLSMKYPEQSIRTWMKKDYLSIYDRHVPRDKVLLGHIFNKFDIYTTWNLVNPGRSSVLYKLYSTDHSEENIELSKEFDKVFIEQLVIAKEKIANGNWDKTKGIVMNISISKLMGIKNIGHSVFPGTYFTDRILKHFINSLIYIMDNNKNIRLKLGEEFKKLVVRHNSLRDKHILMNEKETLVDVLEISFAILVMINDTQKYYFK